MVNHHTVKIILTVGIPTLALILSICFDMKGALYDAYSESVGRIYGVGHFDYLANSELKAESTGFLFKEVSLGGGRNILYCEVTEGWGRRQIFINEGDMIIYIINKGWSRYSERLANSFREDSIHLLFDKSTDGTMGSKWVTRMCGNEKFGTIAYEDRQKATQWVKELYKNLAVKGSLFL